VVSPSVGWGGSGPDGAARREGGGAARRSLAAGGAGEGGGARESEAREGGAAHGARWRGEGGAARRVSAAPSKIRPTATFLSGSSSRSASSSMVFALSVQWEEEEVGRRLYTPPPFSPGWGFKPGLKGVFSPGLNPQPGLKGGGAGNRPSPPSPPPLVPVGGSNRD
jgi:hypothetical protein